jgi:hypothetical protein
MAEYKHVIVSTSRLQKIKYMKTMLTAWKSRRTCLADVSSTCRYSRLAAGSSTDGETRHSWASV